MFRIGMGTNVEEFVPKLAIFAVGAFRLLPSISRSIGHINNIIFYRKFVEATYDNVSAARAYKKDTDERAFDLQKGLDLTDTNIDFTSELSIRNVVWKYKEGKDKVLNGVSLTIKKGEAIGIIGESGSGKSTLADIVLRLYHPQEGEIVMDGINIDAIPDAWSGIIGYVPQTVFLVDDTIRENIVFGAEEQNDDKVWDVLKKASMDKFVRELPKGIDTVVGERGIRFSGGQRQRIAIARALYANPQIMVLDEATSALDNETEEAVMDAIETLAGTMTLIIIAHRVTTLKSCNRIYEIVDGEAIERDKDEVLAVGISKKEGADLA